MKQAFIYYVDLPHPSEATPTEELVYKKVKGYQDTGEIITIPRWMFNKYWKKIPLQFSVFTKYVNKPQAEHIFATLNQDNNPLSAASMQAELRKRGILHTSMSVGDVIATRGPDAKMLIVANMGFKELRLK